MSRADWTTCVRVVAIANTPEAAILKYIEPAWCRSRAAIACRTSLGRGKQVALAFAQVQGQRCEVLADRVRINHPNGITNLSRNRYPETRRSRANRFGYLRMSPEARLPKPSTQVRSLRGWQGLCAPSGSVHRPAAAMGRIAERLRNRIACLEAALADTEGRNAGFEHELQQARAAQALAGQCDGTPAGAAERRYVAHAAAGTLKR